MQVHHCHDRQDSGHNRERASNNIQIVRQIVISLKQLICMLAVGYHISWPEMWASRSSDLPWPCRTPSKAGNPRDRPPVIRHHLFFHRAVSAAPAHLCTSRASHNAVPFLPRVAAGVPAASSCSASMARPPLTLPGAFPWLEGQSGEEGGKKAHDQMVPREGGGCDGRSAEELD